MEKKNLKWVDIGLESGNERIRQSVLSRYYSNDDFFNTVNSARQHNIKVVVYKMRTGMERKEALFDPPGFTKRQILKNYQWFDFNVYKGNKPAYKLLLRVMAVKLTSHPYCNLLFRRIMSLPFLKRIRSRLKKI